MASQAGLVELAWLRLGLSTSALAKRLMLGITTTLRQVLWESSRRLVIPLTVSPGGDRSSDWQLVALFAWQHDRFQHLVGVVPVGGGEDDLIPLLLSVEGEPDRTWPSSPPLQQLDACQLGSGAEGYVGVGMAGRSHWSIAVEPRGESLSFDVACRLQQPAPADGLGSTYRRFDAAGPWKVCIRPVAGRMATIPSDQAESLPRERVEPGPLGDVSFPVTARWTYQVELE